MPRSSPASACASIGMARHSGRPLRANSGHCRRLVGRRWRSPGSRAKGFCARQGLRRRGASMCLAISTPAVLPLLDGNISAPNLSDAAQYLACALPCERFTSALAGSPCITQGRCVRYAFTVTDFHRLPLAGLPAHPSTPSFPGSVANGSIRAQGKALRAIAAAAQGRGHRISHEDVAGVLRTAGVRIAGVAQHVHASISDRLPWNVFRSLKSLFLKSERH